MMKVCLALFAVLAWGGLFGPASAADYTLHAGDQIQVSVWGEDTLDRELVVLPDGSITFPLAGRIEVAGLTSTEVEGRIAEGLSDAIPDPAVTIIIKAVSGNRVYVLGKVNKPGAYVLEAAMTTSQILSLAGGFDRFADTGSIRILRNQDGTQTSIEFNYGRLFSGKGRQEDIPLQAGDVILAP